MKYIAVDDFLEVLNGIGLSGNKFSSGNTIVALLGILPKRDVVPVVHAKWVGVSPMVDSVACSKCGYNIWSDELETPFCPWCGAKMDADKE